MHNYHCTSSMHAVLIDYIIEYEGYSEPIDNRIVSTELNEYAAIGPNTSKVSTIAIANFTNIVIMLLVQ